MKKHVEYIARSRVEDRWWRALERFRSRRDPLVDGIKEERHHFLPRARPTQTETGVRYQRSPPQERTLRGSSSETMMATSVRGKTEPKTGGPLGYLLLSIGVSVGDHDGTSLAVHPPERD